MQWIILNVLDTRRNWTNCVTVLCTNCYSTLNNSLYTMSDMHVYMHSEFYFKLSATIEETFKLRKAELYVYVELSILPYICISGYQRILHSYGTYRFSENMLHASSGILHICRFKCAGNRNMDLSRHLCSTVRIVRLAIVSCDFSRHNNTVELLLRDHLQFDCKVAVKQE